MSILDIANTVAEEQDLTVDATFVRQLPRVGPALLRFREYFELGVQEPANPKNKPSVQCKFVFELLHPDHMLKDTEGNPYPAVVSVSLPKGSTAKSMYRKLFKKMNYAGTATHFSQLLGKGFLGQVFHNKSGTATYVNIRYDSEWFIGAPSVQDPLDASKVTQIPVPEMQGTPRLFVWEAATLTEDMVRECWASLYIAGTYEKDGKDVSKNWIQEAIRSSLEWEGSATQSAVDNDIDLAGVVQPEDSVVETTKEVVQETIDPLAALGLV